MVKWLQQHYDHIGCSSDAMDGAATNGHFEIVKFLHYNHREGCTTKAMNGAARNDVNRREGCTTKAMDGAASNGYLFVVEVAAQASDREMYDQCYRWGSTMWPLQCAPVARCQSLPWLDASNELRGRKEQHRHTGVAVVAQRRELVCGRCCVRRGRIRQWEVLEWLATKHPDLMNGSANRARVIAPQVNRWSVYQWLQRLSSIQVVPFRLGVSPSEDPNPMQPRSDRCVCS
jgi:hypothetical protein